MSNTNHRVFNNAAWLIGCKIVQSLINLLITMLSARYLGPSNYGLISYAASIVAFVVPVMQLGFRSTFVQEIIEQPKYEGAIIGTAITLNITSSLACIIGIISFVAIANAGEPQTIAVCFLYSISLIFQATEMIQYWFQAKLLSKYTALTMLVSYVVVSLYKIFLLINGMSVQWFSLAYSIDYFIISIILFIIYHRIGGVPLSFSLELAKHMLYRSKYYIISGLMVTIFQQTDRIMLKLMVNNETTGYYSAAVTCSGLTSFIYNAIIDSFRPMILENKRRSESTFEQKLIQLYSIIIWISIAQGIVMSFGAELIIKIIYGADYMPSAKILPIGVWFVTFAHLGTIRNIWILAEGKQRYLWIINLSGATVNILLNLLLIPTLGAVGAALASVTTQFFTNFILSYIIKPISPVNTLAFKGLDPRIFINMLR